MRTNSVISDPTPFDFEPPKKVEKKQVQNDFEKIANSENYPEIINYLDSRIEFHQRFLPNGEPVENQTKEKLIEHWGAASTIISELLQLKRTIQAFKRSE